MEIYFESDYVKILYEQSAQYVKLLWLTPPTNEEFKEGCGHMLTAIGHFGVRKTLVDARLQGAVHSDLIEWMGETWVKRAAVLGQRHCAVISPTDVFASFSLSEIAPIGVRAQVITEYFDNEEHAVDWFNKLTTA
ncbi:hypothetical protein JMN32_14050 [Fulvivirga sp. 29W222]|uniref:STAS/SEC14 domain-containing protein n=1 Tax=Fulvivirga marina TaxID=2494733 RepID=A0A937KBV3_9BACT|nr:hypothetical protein [Fulvivirga marina]MBL6447436.1 hypothetical protein [Fulvivirga marina]